MSQFVPGVNLSNLYVNNLQMAYASATTITVAAGQCRDSNNIIDMVLSSSTTVNTAINGINGLDVGTIAASTWYYVFVIADSSGYNPTGCLLSLSATAPSLPSHVLPTSLQNGYDSIRLIGQILTDGSSNILKFYQSGSQSVREYQWDSMISVLAAGAATSFTAVSLAAAVPPFSNTKVTFYGALTPATAGNAASFRPTGSTATTVFSFDGTVMAVVQSEQFTLTAGIESSVAKVDYKVSNGSDALSVSVVGYKQYL